MQPTPKANTLCLLEILKIYTDSDHSLKMSEIISKMESVYGLKVERRTIYSCVTVLTEMGYSVLTPEETGDGYCLDEHEFDASEIRLLMDSVYANQTVEVQYSKQLIENLRKLLTEYKRRRYANLFVINSGRKTDNKQVFLNIEEIDDAIISGRKVSFAYLVYGFDKKLHPKRKDPYTVSPYAMIAAIATNFRMESGNSNGFSSFISPRFVISIALSHRALISSEDKFKAFLGPYSISSITVALNN